MPGSVIVTPDLQSYFDSTTVKRLIKQCGSIEEAAAAQAHVLITTDSNIAQLCSIICGELAVNSSEADSLLVKAADGMIATLPDLLRTVQQYHDGDVPQPPGWHAPTRQSRVNAKLLNRSAQHAVPLPIVASDGAVTAGDDNLPASVKRYGQQTLRDLLDTWCQRHADSVQLADPEIVGWDVHNPRLDVFAQFVDKLLDDWFLTTKLSIHRLLKRAGEIETQTTRNPAKRKARNAHAPDDERAASHSSDTSDGVGEEGACGSNDKAAAAAELEAAAAGQAQKDGGNAAAAAAAAPARRPSAGPGSQSRAGKRRPGAQVLGERPAKQPKRKETRVVVLKRAVTEQDAMDMAEARATVNEEKLGDRPGSFPREPAKLVGEEVSNMFDMEGGPVIMGGRVTEFLFARITGQGMTPPWTLEYEDGDTGEAEWFELKDLLTTWPPPGL